MLAIYEQRVLTKLCEQLLFLPSNVTNHVVKAAILGCYTIKIPFKTPLATSILIIPTKTTEFECEYQI